MKRNNQYQRMHEILYYIKDQMENYEYSIVYLKNYAIKICKVKQKINKMNNHNAQELKRINIDVKKIESDLIEKINKIILKKKDQYLSFFLKSLKDQESKLPEVKIFKYKLILTRLVKLIKNACINYQNLAKKRNKQRNSVLNILMDKAKNIEAYLQNYETEAILESQIIETIELLEKQSKLTKENHLKYSHFNFNFLCVSIRLTKSRLAKKIDAVLDDPLIKKIVNEMCIEDSIILDKYLP